MELKSPYKKLGDDSVLIHIQRFDKEPRKYMNKLEIWIKTNGYLDEVGYPYGMHFYHKYGNQEFIDHPCGYYRSPIPLMSRDRQFPWWVHL